MKASLINVLQNVIFFSAFPSRMRCKGTHFFLLCKYVAKHFFIFLYIIFYLTDYQYGSLLTFFIPFSSLKIPIHLYKRARDGLLVTWKKIIKKKVPHPHKGKRTCFPSPFTQRTNGNKFIFNLPNFYQASLTGSFGNVIDSTK